MPTLAELAPVGLDPKAKAEKRLGQRERILALLEAAGPRGCSSEELNAVGYRYGGRLFELREQGYIIETHGRTGTELARYILKGKLAPGDQVPLF